jgi:hypothetical protein
MFAKSNNRKAEGQKAQNLLRKLEEGQGTGEDALEAACHHQMIDNIAAV